MMVSFDDPQLGDAADELERLGGDFSAEVLLYLQKVYRKDIDYRTRNPFYIYQGVEMFHASMGGNEFAIFAVEVDDMGDLTISLMLAGRHGTPMQAGAFSWDGVSYPALRSGLLNARAAVWFT
jgi:hypothetical protein